MREILFRGKRVDNGEWVEGYVYYTLTLKKTYCFITTINNDKSLGYSVEIIPETVGQYTELPDKNGKKIFEGDVVTDKKAKNIGVITSGVYEECPEYYADHNGYYVKWTDNSFKPQLNFWCRQKYIEVIGNIFDNSELLEANQC